MLKLFKILLVFILLIISLYAGSGRKERSNHRERNRHNDHFARDASGIIVGSDILTDILLRTPRTVIRYEREPIFHPGHYEYRNIRIWISDQKEKVWKEERRDWRWEHGKKKLVATPGYYEYVIIPGHYEEEQEKVWVEESWCY
jgi:hypothetical protein